MSAAAQGVQASGKTIVKATSSGSHAGLATPSPLPVDFYIKPIDETVSSLQHRSGEGNPFIDCLCQFFFPFWL